MSENSLENWREHIEDFVLIRNTLEYASGKKMVSYLIVEFKPKTYFYTIENEARNKALAEAMIAAGVRVVSHKEWLKSAHPEMFADGNFLDAYYRHHYPDEEDEE